LYIPSPPAAEEGKASVPEQVVPAETTQVVELPGTQNVRLPTD